MIADIHETADEIRALKAVLRRTWTRPMADEQERLVKLKRHATALCVLRAWSRGRRHLVNQPHDDGAAGCVWFGAAWDAADYERRVVNRFAERYPSPSRTCTPASGGEPQVEASA